MILHENVGEFPFKFLQSSLASQYVLDERNSVVIDSRDHGQAYERVRRLSILLHKSQIKLDVGFPSSLKAWEVTCRRDCKFSWRSYFWASEDEFKEEIKWASGRPASMAGGSMPVESLVPLQRRDFYDTLTEAERNFHAIYSGLAPSGCAFLGQSPDKRRSHNEGKAELMTMTEHPDLAWSFEHSRWLTPREMQLVHNYPMRADCQNFNALTSFNVSRESKGLPARKRNAVKKQVGNGMSLCCIGVALHWAIMYRSFRAERFRLCRRTSSALASLARLPVRKTIGKDIQVTSSASRHPRDRHTFTAVELIEGSVIQAGCLALALRTFVGAIATMAAECHSISGITH
eukprot:2400814-Pyramimonas_sp.AAC.1